MPVRIRQQLIGREALLQPAVELPSANCLEPSATCDAQTVERNVPYQLFPMRALQIIPDAARHARVPECAGNIVGSRFGPATMFPQFNLSVRYMVNYAR